MKKLVLNVNVAAPLNMVTSAIGFVLKPMVKAEQHFAKASAEAALKQLMETDEGKLKLFNLLLAAKATKEGVTE